MATGVLLLASAAGAKESVETCRAEFPDLLSRADRELAPWDTPRGITRAMLDNLWRCDEGAPGRHPSAYRDVRRFVGLRAVVSRGNMNVEKAVGHKTKMYYTRPETLELMLR